MKNLKYLLGLSLCFALMSCGKKFKSIIDQKEVASEKITTNTNKLNKLIPTEQELTSQKEWLLFFQITTITKEKVLAIVLQEKGSEFKLSEMDKWVDKVIASIKTIDSILTDEKIGEVKQLRDAETDAELIARYDAIIARMEANTRRVTLNTSWLKEKTKKAIINLEAVENWIIKDTARSAVWGKALSNSFQLQAAMARLDVKLSK